MAKGIVTKVELNPPKNGGSYLAYGRATIGDAMRINVFIRESKGETYVSWPGRMVNDKWMSDVYIIPEAADAVNGAVLKAYNEQFGNKKSAPKPAEEPEEF